VEFDQNEILLKSAARKIGWPEVLRGGWVE
jgi:hypothetical protein